MVKTRKSCIGLQKMYEAYLKNQSIQCLVCCCQCSWLATNHYPCSTVATHWSWWSSQSGPSLKLLGPVHCDYIVDSTHFITKLWQLVTHTISILSRIITWQHLQMIVLCVVVDHWYSWIIVSVQESHGSVSTWSRAQSSWWLSDCSADDAVQSVHCETWCGHRIRSYIDKYMIYDIYIWFGNALAIE